MQVLCIKVKEEQPCSIRCPKCGQDFAVYYSRFAETECEEARKEVQRVLLEHHAGSSSQHTAHMQDMFNVPAWNGLPQYSGAALLSGAPCERPKPRAVPSHKLQESAPERMVS